MNALLPVEGGNPFLLSRGEGFPGADLDAELVRAVLAEFRIEEHDVIRVAGRGLDLPPQEKGILM